MRISIIVAMGEGGVIGVGGKLPWHLPEDLKRFKARTLGHTLIMGRKTFESIGRALPGRRTLVISQQAPGDSKGVEWFSSLDAALAAAEGAGETECFLAGGAAVYAEGLKRADRMYVTYVRGAVVKGDTHFPQWDEALWRAVKREAVGGMEFVAYERAGKGH